MRAFLRCYYLWRGGAGRAATTAHRCSSWSIYTRVSRGGWGCLPGRMEFPVNFRRILSSISLLCKGENNNKVLWVARGTLFEWRHCDFQQWHLFTQVAADPVKLVLKCCWNEFVRLARQEPDIELKCHGDDKSSVSRQKRARLTVIGRECVTKELYKQDGGNGA